MTHDNTMENLEDRIVGAVSTVMARAIEREDGPFQGGADIEEIDEMRVIITGTLHFGSLAQEIIATALWLHVTQPHYLDYLAEELDTAKDVIAGQDQ